jgi:DNA-binding HxlR family transcriptional regulator
MPLKVRKNKAPPPLPGCPLTECMALLAGAWTPNVIWYLSGGRRRFMELRTDMPTISAKVLSTRLRELEQKGVITRTVMPTSPPSVEYALTELGQELMPAIRAIVDVGHKLKSRGGGEHGARRERTHASDRRQPSEPRLPHALA